MTPPCGGLAIPRYTADTVADDSSDDEALGSRADEIKRIAGDDRDRPGRRRVEHGHVGGIDDPRALDPVRLATVTRLEGDLVASLDVLEASKESVPVAGNAAIALVSRGGSVGNVA